MFVRSVTTLFAFCTHTALVDGSIEIPIIFNVGQPPSFIASFPFRPPGTPEEPNLQQPVLVNKSIYPSLYDDSRFEIARRDGLVNSSSHSITFYFPDGLSTSLYDDGLRLRYHTERFAVIESHSIRRGLYLGIGPGSQIVAQKGSASIVLSEENRILLRLGSGIEEFSTSCRPGTLSLSSPFKMDDLYMLNVTRVSLYAPTHAQADEGAAAASSRSLVDFLWSSLGYSTTSTSTGAGGPSRSSVAVTIQAHPGSGGVQLSRRFAREVAAYIQQLGGVMDGETPFGFSSCSADIIAELPRLYISIGDHDYSFDATSSYMKWDHVRNSCIINVWGSDSDVAIDPFTLGGTNFFISSTQIGICESNIADL